VDFFLILSVQVRLSATSLSEVALKVWQAPCTLSASVGPASQTELSASAALALCVQTRAPMRLDVVHEREDALSLGSVDRNEQHEDHKAEHVALMCEF